MRSPLLVVLALVGLTAHTQVAAQDQSLRSDEVTINTDFPVSGQDHPIEVIFTFDVEDGSLHLRPLASNDAYTAVPGQPTSPRRFTGTVPGQLLRPQGIEFFVSYVRDGEELTVPEVNPEQDPIRFPTLTLRHQPEVQLIPRRYRMLSIPFQFDSDFGPDFADGSLASVFGAFGPAPERWRALRWDPESEQYLEGVAAVPVMRPGEAFWVVTSTGGHFEVRGGITPGFEFGGDSPGEAPVRVILEPGWNQVGNPFLFPIAWQEVANSGLVNEPFGFDGSGYVPGQTTLQPWTGYFVFNPTSSFVELRFEPPRGQQPPTARPFAVRYLESLGEAAYLVQVVATAGEQRDEHTYLGLSAQQGLDDLRKPPPATDDLQVSIADGEARWAARAARLGEPAVWTVQFSAGWAQPRPVTVSLEEHGTPPAGFALAVFDGETGAAVPMPGTQFSFHLGGSQSARSFRVELVHSDNLPVPEAADRLAAPFPNPARSGSQRVTFHVWGSEDAGVTIDVLDVLGRRILVIEDDLRAGRWQPVEWDGRDAAGRLLPAGLYLIRYRSGTTQLTRTITLL